MRSRTLFPRAPQILNPNGSIAWTISAPQSAPATVDPPVVLPVSPPVNMTLPAIFGTATQGQTLTASAGTWTNSPSGYAYQWRRGGVAIGGAVASAYLLALADVGATITVEVIASNAGGASAPAVSAATAAVAGAGASVPDAFTIGQWTLADSPSAGGDTLTINITALPSNGGASITALEYTLNGGSSWTALSGTGTGARNITVLASTLASVAIRAVNAVGNGTASDTKTATPTTSGAVIGVPLTTTVGPASLDTDERYTSSDTAWSTRSNVLVDDATAATWTNGGSNRGSEMLHVRFAATSIPTDAVVTGIEISARCNNAANASLPLCYLTFDGVVSNSAGYNAQATDLFTGLQTRVFGQDGFTFGSSITPGDLNAGRVGCALRVFRVGAGASTSSMQYVSMKVYYTTLIGKASRGMSVATVLLPFDATGMATRRVRAAFPVGLGTPSAILFQTMTFDRADFTNYLTRLDTQPSVTSSVGCAINGAAVGGWIDINNSGTFAGNTATVHDSRSTPFAGQGGANGDQAVFSNNTSAFAKPVTWGAGYVEFECLGSTSPTAGFLTVQAIYADNVHMYVDDGFGVSEANTRVITTGFAPNLIIGLTPPDRYNSAVHEAYTGLQFSLAKWDGAAWVNRGLGVVTASRERDSGTGVAGPMAATRNSWELMEDAVYHDWNPNYAGTGVEGTYSVNDYRYGITARSATTYTIRSYLDQNPGQSNMVFIALDMGSTPFDIGFFDLPTATGAANLATSYQPSGALIAMTNCTATGRRRDVADTGAVSFAALSIDGYAVTNGYFSEHGKAAPNPNANSVMDMAGLTMIDVTAATAFQASVTQFNADGIAIDVTTAATGTNKALGLFIG